MYIMQNTPFMSLVTAILPRISETKLCLFSAAQLPEATRGPHLANPKGQHLKQQLHRILTPQLNWEIWEKNKAAPLRCLQSCVSMSLTESSEETLRSFCCPPAWGCPCPHQAHAGLISILVPAQNVQDALAKIKVLSGLQQHCLLQTGVKREGATFPMGTLSSITQEFENLGWFLCQGTSETPICQHPALLFLHDLFIETTATFSHKQLEQLEIFIPIYIICETEKPKPNLSCPVNCQDSTRKYEFHVSLEELASIQAPHSSGLKEKDFRNISHKNINFTKKINEESVQEKKKKMFTGTRSQEIYPGHEHWLEDKVHNRWETKPKHYLGQQHHWDQEIGEGPD